VTYRGRGKRNHNLQGEKIRNYKVSLQRKRGEKTSFEGREAERKGPAERMSTQGQGESGGTYVRSLPSV